MVVRILWRVLEKGSYFVVTSATSAELGWLSVSKDHLHTSNFLSGWSLLFLIVAGVFGVVALCRTFFREKENVSQLQKQDHAYELAVDTNEKTTENSKVLADLVLKVTGSEQYVTASGTVSTAGTAHGTVSYPDGNKDDDSTP
jgi:hypothetical protein